MKTLKKVWFRTFILAISFIAISCSVEEEIVKNNQGIIHRKIKFDELKKDKVVMDDLSNYSKIMRQSNLKQKSTDSLDVNFSSANYVETDEFISYTFNMPSSSVPLRNFLLKKQKNSTGGYHGYVLNYNLTQEELNSLNTLELTNLSNKVTSVKIGSNFSPAMFGKNVYCPGIVGICYVGDPDGHVAYGSECTVSAVQVEMFPCPEEGGGGTPSDPINPPPPNDNTGGSDSNQIVIIPTFNDSDFFDFDNQCKANFFISPSVTSDMRNWLNHFNNIFFKNKIYEMVEDQSSCEENHTEALAIWNFLYNNQSVASSIIDFVTQGGDQNLAWILMDDLLLGADVNFVKKIILDPSFKNNPCLKSVYDGMVQNSSTANNYLSNFDSNMSVANLKFAGSNTLSSNTNATTSPPSHYLITITFNTNNLNRTKLSIARTFIHELIHAEIFRKLLSLSNHPSINLTNNDLVVIKENFPGLYDYYVRYLYNVPSGQVLTDPQHQLMAQHYRNTISNSIKEFDNNQQTQDVYDALAWVGLMGEGTINMTTGLGSNPTVAWQNLTQTERINILNTVTSFENSNTNCQ